MRTSRIAAVAGLALAAAFSPGCSDANASGNAPDFTLDEVEGGQVSLSDYRGRGVLLVFWAVG